MVYGGDNWRTYACAVVLVGGVGVVIAGDDDERDPAVGCCRRDRVLLLRLEQVDLRADVALEVAGVQHARAADGEVHAARQQPAGGAPAQLVCHRCWHSHGRSCIMPHGSNSKQQTDTELVASSA